MELSAECAAFGEQLVSGYNAAVQLNVYFSKAELAAAEHDKKAAIDKAAKDLERKKAKAAKLRDKATAAVAAAEAAEAEVNEAADKLALLQIAE